MPTAEGHKAQGVLRLRSIQDVNMTVLVVAVKTPKGPETACNTSEFINCNDKSTRQFNSLPFYHGFDPPTNREVLLSSTISIPT
jgi:hypothetical protein